MFEVVRCGGLSSLNRPRPRFLLGRSGNIKDREPSRPAWQSPLRLTEKRHPYRALVRDCDPAEIFRASTRASTGGCVKCKPTSNGWGVRFDKLSLLSLLSA